MKKILLIILLIPCSLFLFAQKTDKKLEKEIVKLTEGFNGEIGVYIKNMRTGKTVLLNADTIFPTASMVKIPILIGIMNKIEEGVLQDTMNLEYKDSLLYAGIDILGSFKEGEKITLSRVIMLMLTVSDNTASLWLQSLAGTGTTINALLENMGFEHTRVNSRTPGRQANQRTYGWGQTTPAEMGRLMELIVNQQVISDDASKTMLRRLGRNFFDHVAISEIPPNVFVASKNGAVNASRSEVLYVNCKGNPYLLVVCTKNNNDISWKNDNEAWVLTRKISRLVWEHYSR